jgi:mono/diheme cytochrome c family protein
MLAGVTLASRRHHFRLPTTFEVKTQMRYAIASVRPAFRRFAALALAVLVPVLLVVGAAQAQTSSAEEARMIEFGKEIFKSKAVCQYCHKWDASGDQGYGGNALSLRVTQLTPDQLTEVVKCGRPGTGMPYHDRFAYTDKRCFGYTRDQMGKDMPPAGNDFLSNREVEAVVKYLFAKDVGKGPATYDDCVDFWGKDTKQCDPMKK